MRDWETDEDEEMKPRLSVVPPKPLVSLTPHVWADASSIRPRDWLYGKHIIRGYVSTTIAPGGLGKSSLVMAEAIAMAVGKPLLGDQVRKPLRVWYWNGEDDQEENARRIAAIAKRYDLTEEDLGGRLFVDSGRDQQILIASANGQGLQINRPLIHDLTEQIKDKGIDVFLLDPLVAAHAVSENDNMAMNGVVRAIAGICHQAQCGSDLVHHIRKPGSGITVDTDVNDARGASALIGGVRSARVLNVMSEEQAALWGIENRLQYFTVTNGKSNLAPRSDHVPWRHIKSIPLGNEVDGQEDHIGVVERWEVPDAKSSMPHDVAIKVRALVAAGEYRADSRSPDWLGNELFSLTGLDPTDKSDQPKIIKLIKAWIDSDVIAKDMRRDKNRIMKPFLVPGSANLATETFE